MEKKAHRFTAKEKFEQLMKECSELQEREEREIYKQIETHMKKGESYYKLSYYSGGLYPLTIQHLIDDGFYIQVDEDTKNVFNYTIVWST